MGKRPAASLTMVKRAAKRVAKLREAPAEQGSAEAQQESAEAAPAPEPDSARQERAEIEEKCKAVSKALGKSQSLPGLVSSMLGDVIPFSLALCKDDRHPFQQSVVQVVDAEMRSLEGVRTQAMEEAESSLNQLGREKEELETKVAALEADQEAHRPKMNEKKHALADAALGVRAGKEALEEAEAKMKLGDKDLQETNLKHTVLKGIITEILEPLKEGTVEAALVRETAEGLVPRLQAFFDVEESLVPAIPAVLAKAPSARGSFDTMAAMQLEEQAQKALEELGAKLKSGEATRQANVNAADSAREALTAAREKQRACATAFLVTQAEAENLDAELQSIKSTMRQLGLERTKRLRAVAKAEEGLAAFRQGPLAAFTELSERSAQAPPAEEEAREEAAERTPAHSDAPEVTGREAEGMEAAA